jgi:RecB family endonuclease NucS
MAEWKSENEIQEFLVHNCKEALVEVIGTKIKEISTEVVIPFGAPRKARNVARIDILIEDVEGNYHIVEVKHPKNDVIANAQGVAQLLFYDAMLSQKSGIEAKTLILATSTFDVVTNNIIPRNKLKVKVVKINKDCLEVVSSYTYVGSNR